MTPEHYGIYDEPDGKLIFATIEKYFIHFNWSAERWRWRCLIEKQIPTMNLNELSWTDTCYNLVDMLNTMLFGWFACFKKWTSTGLYSSVQAKEEGRMLGSTFC